LQNGNLAVFLVEASARFVIMEQTATAGGIDRSANRPYICLINSSMSSVRPHIAKNQYVLIYVEQLYSIKIARILI
jgi:hypothetical protein